LDGTIYLGDYLLPGIEQLIRELRAKGSRTVYLSNNPTKNPQMYADKLTSLGVPTRPDEVVNPLVTLADWLAREAPGSNVFVMGSQPLQEAVRAAGCTLCHDPELIDIVVASYDKCFDYARLQIAFDALWLHRRARLIATNPDAYCPMPGGRGEPDAAAVVAAVEACTGAKCEVNLGKPNPLMLTTALDLMGLPPEKCLMVGDRIYTDVAMAVDAGVDSALVLTGESTVPMVAALDPARRPTYVLASAVDLAAAG